MGQIELFLFETIQMQIELLVLVSNTWNQLIVWKQMSSGLFKNVPYKQIIYKSVAREET